MATAENGTVVEDSKAISSGQFFSKRKAKRSAGVTRWALGVILRLCIWYALLTPFFHCPSSLSELEDTSPRVCRPHLIARSYLDPHIKPYYQTYGAPYIEIAKPHAQRFNEQIYMPVAKFATQTYGTYGAPRLEQGLLHIQQRWDVSARPWLDDLRRHITQLYDSLIGPRIIRASSAITPYYTAAVKYLAHVHKSYILPYYTRSKPIAGKAYFHVHDIVVDILLPYSYKSWSSVVAFINGTLWPRITGLYSENVEPQLVKIEEKLASYREGRNLIAPTEDIESPTEVSVSAPSTAFPSEAAIGKTSNSNFIVESAPAKTSLTPSEQIEHARQKIASDLRTWQEKFAIAADRGVEELQVRVEHIVQTQLEGGTLVRGEGLVLALETVAKEELEVLKHRICSIVESLPDYSDLKLEEIAQDQLLQALRISGFAIREQAHALREWFNNFDGELVTQVSAVSSSTVAVLDDIRDLGLQEIGMRWAWMDGVTYKDWEKYHALRQQFEDWGSEVWSVGMQHEALQKARDLGNDILSGGMQIAEKAAKELSRVKVVGEWKIQAGDASGDFEIQTIPAAEARASKRAALGLDEQHESIPDLQADSQSIGSLVPGRSIEVVPEASSDSVGTTDVSYSENDRYSQSQSPVITSDANAFPAVRPVQSELHASPNIQQAADPVGEQPQSPMISAEDNPKSVSGTTSDEDPGPTSIVCKNAAANIIHKQNHPPSHYIDETYRFIDFEQRERIAAAEMLAEASSLYSDSVSQAKKLYDIAKSIASAKTSEIPHTMQEKLLASIGSAHSDSLKLASDKLESRIQAASQYLGPSNPAPSEVISSIASARLQEGLSSASAQYLHVMTTATPIAGPAHQQILLDARKRYYEAVGLEHDRYSVFINSASELLEGTPSAGESRDISVLPEETSIPCDQNLPEGAESQYSVAFSLASASLDAVLYSVSSVWGSVDQGVAQNIVEDASSRYRDALSAITASLCSTLHRTPTPLAESLTTEESRHWEYLVSKASKEIYGDSISSKGILNTICDLSSTRPSTTESVTSHVKDRRGLAALVADACVTTLPAIEGILNSASAQLRSVLEAVDIQIHHLPDKIYEQATSVASDAHSFEFPQRKETIPIVQQRYIAEANEEFDTAVATAHSAICMAIYGTLTIPTANSATDREHLIVYQSATSKLSAVAENARAQLIELGNKLNNIAPVPHPTPTFAAGESMSTATVAESEASRKTRDEL